MATPRLNQIIEHTLLKPSATSHDVSNLCQQARNHQLFGVCVNPFWAQHALEQLQDTMVKVVSVVGFPLGANLTSVKVTEAHRLVAIGVDEIDMVMNLGALFERNYDIVANDIRSVHAACEGRPLKVIIETGLLNYQQKLAALQICKDAEVEFVKTSTGFNGGGASIRDIELMRQILPKSIKIKASAGIRTRQQALELHRSGADRIGTSQGVTLVTTDPSLEIF